ncbi:transcription factor Adf-1-like [Aphis craccivora]|uniref:Transcription factor Adf-1-like n=1 Tax=Aphis craccivora TaxID=307492 RepID=A0A6G0Y4N2_APHCR|nr:transcription factor Adf-1-like [Aphis craccivora]
MTAEIVKQKWKNLRDSYIKYINYLKGSTGSGKKYKNWPWAAHLEFLRDTVAPRATTSNVSESQIPETSITDEDYEPGESDSGYVTFPTQIPPPKRTTKRKELTEDMAAVLSYFEKKIAIKLIQNSTTLTISSCRMHIRLRHFRQERKLSLKWRCHSYLDELNLMRLAVIIQHAHLQCTPQLRLGQMSTQTKLLKMTLVMLFKYSTILTYTQMSTQTKQLKITLVMLFKHSTIQTYIHTLNQQIL